MPGRSPLPTAGPALAGLVLLLLLPARDATARPDVDPRWLPWLGCWSAVGSEGGTLCVRPADGAEGVELVTLRDGGVESVERLRADGVARETSREGCSGTEAAVFSSDGRRLYLRSDFTCEGDVDRRGTGLLAMVTPDAWIRVRTVEVAGETAAVTERWREAPEGTARAAGLEDPTEGRGMAVSAARRAAAARPDVEDLVEASRRVEPEAVRTWVAERGRPLDVDAEKLVRLADAGVAEEVIDVVVAVSFPERFAVDRDARGRDAGAAGPAYGRGFRRPRLGRGYHDPFFGYSRFGYGTPFLHGWWYGTHRPTVIVIRPREGDADGGGRVVSGRGYTRGSEGAGDRGLSVPRATSPSGGSVTPAGATSGRPSGSTGRKAKPREGSSGDGNGPGGGGSS